MKDKLISLPEIALIAGTRVALGAGLAFLVSGKFNNDQRKGAGWALFGFGVLSSIPLLATMLTKPAISERPLVRVS